MKQSLRDVYGLDLAIVTGYVILYRLNKEKLVTVETNDQGKSQRKYYSITPKGEKALLAAKEFIGSTYNLLFNEKMIDTGSKTG